MERSKQTSPLQRLLAFALSLLLVLSILPANLLTAEGAVAYTLEVNKAGNGTGDVYYSVDGGSQQKVQFSGSTGSIQLTYDEETGDLPERLDLTFEAGAYSRITAISLPDEFNTVTDDKSISHQLTNLDELFGGIEGTASCSVAFDLEQAYTVTRGTAAHVKLYVKALDDSDFIQLPADGRVLYESQLPVTVKVEPAAEYFTIQTVQIQGQEGPVTLDENGKFELNTGAFTSDHVAAIDVTTEFIPTEALRLLYSISTSGGWGTATIKKNGSAEPVTLNTGYTSLQPSELPATVTITAPNKKVIKTATLNGTDLISTEVETLEVNLTAESFLNGDAILNPLELHVDFQKSDSTATTLIIGNSPNYDVWVKNNGGEYQAAPQNSEVELSFPATVKVQSKSEDYWVESIALNTDDGNLGDSNTAAAPYIEKVLDEATFDKYAEVQLQATMVRVYDISLAGDSSQYAQVTGSVMQNGSYSEPGTEITAGTPLTVPSGSKVKIKVTALEGHTLEGVTVNNAEPVGLTNDGTIATFVMNNVIADLPIKVTTGDLYRVELEPYDSDKGTVELLDENGNLIDTIASGSGKWLKLDQLTGAKLKFKPKPSGDETVVVSDVEIGGGQERANNKTSGEVFSEKTLDQYSFTDNKLVVTVAFKTLYTVKVEINPDEETGDLHGTAKINNAEGDYTALDGEEITVTAIPNSGYLVFSIKGYDDQNLNYNPDDNGGQYVKITVTGDLTVKVEFQPRANLSGIWFERNGERITAFNQFNSPALQVFVFGPSTSPVELKTYVGPFPFTVFHNNFNYDSFWHDYIHSYNSQWESISESKQITWLSYCIGEYTYSYFENLWYDVPSPSNSDSAEQNMYVIIDNTSPTVEIDETEYCSHYFMSAPEIKFTVTDGPDPVTSNAPEAATHAFSGIKTVYYYIGEFDESLGATSDNRIYESENGGVGSKPDLSKELTELVADGEYKVTFVAEDFAGNKGHKTITVRINSTLNLVFDDYEPSTVVDDKPCYQEYRYATITVVDAEGFDENGISFGGNWPNAEYCSSWSNGENGVHTRRICFKDGQYNLSKLTYAGTTITAEIEPGDKFIVDTENPTASLELDEGNSWNSPITGQPTFSVWKTGAVTLTANPADTGSGVKQTHYYIQYFTDETGETDGSFLTKEVLDDFYAQGQWTLYEGGIPVAANKRCVVYLRVEDKVNNYIYINTNGIITDSQDPTAGIELPPTSYAHEGRNLYGIAGGSNVEVTISAADPEIRSGLKKVSYLVTKTYTTEAEALAGTGWTEIDLAPGADPSYSDLTNTFNRVINVKKADFNVCSVYVYLKVEDNAGRTVVKHTVFDIDYTAPTIAIEPDLTDDHIVWITYTERSPHFESSNAVQGLTLVGLYGNGTSMNLRPNTDYRISWTEGEENNDLDTDTHLMKVELLTNARYTISASFTDLAGNPTETGETFITVDEDPPEAKITIEGKGTWEELLETLTFGLWSQDTVNVTGWAKDEISGLKSISYYLTDGSTTMDTDALDAVDAWTEIEKEADEWGLEDSFKVTNLDPNQKAVVYLRAVDNKDRVRYVCTDGIVVDNKMQKEWITLTPSDASGADSNGKPIYNKDNDVYVEVSVKDYEEETDANSGIKLVTYEISAPNCETETGTLYSYEFTGSEEHPRPSYDELTHERNVGQIDVDKEKFNSCEVKITVKVTDNAGNEAEKSVVVDIDNTDPTIAIARDEAKCVKLDGADDDFYNAYTALITYTERTHHFSEADAEAKLVVTATNADGDLALTRGVDYLIVGWQHTEDPTDPDKDAHVMEIEFRTDANYKIVANYTDLAGNAAGTQTPTFTLDTQAPTGSVTVGDKGTWTILLETLTFGLWSKETVTVIGSAEDAVSNLKSVMYYKTADTAIKSDTELDGVTEWTELADGWGSEQAFDVTTVSPNEKFVIYLRLMDQAGNFRYLSTDGVVVDDEMKREWIELSAPETNVTLDGKPVYGIRAADEEGNIYVNVSVRDYENKDDPNSGIGVVNYEISAPNCETESGTLYLYDYTRTAGDNANGGTLIISENGKQISEEMGAIPAYEDLPHEWSGTIPVNVEKYNSCDVTVRVTVGDNALNDAFNEITFDIDNTAPTIEVSYDTESNPGAVDGYYTAVTATVTITERDHHFNMENANNGITITGVDGSGKKLTLTKGTDYVISDWTLVKGSTPDEDKHIATITFKTDANYTLEIGFTDLAGNEAESYRKEFTKDATKPTGTLKIEALTDKTWVDQIIETLTFALFSRSSVEVAHTASDETSPLISVDYFRTDRDTVYSETELAGLDENSWQSAGQSNFAKGSISAGPDARAVVYLRVIDAAGNIRYVSTDGFILDATNPTVDEVAPKVTVSQPVNGIYNTDVPVKVQVSDPIVNGSYSGLKEIRYEVRNMGTVTQSGTLYTYSGTAAAQKDLLQNWANDPAITVDKEKNNSNNVEILVYAVDNAGNEGQGSAEIQIDTTAPTISVSYDNNNGDTSFANNETGAYFNAPRTATIVVTERNFDENAVIVTVMRDGVQQRYNLSWTKNEAGGNGDGTTHTARITFADDGDYTFAISCTDKAGNKNKDVTFNGLAPERFSIDMTKPAIEVKYDNNNQKNDTFFNAPRIATITITEHNFEESRIGITVTAKNGGQTIPTPGVSGWTNSGDTHTAQIEYKADGDYTFDITYKDKAGNENDKVSYVGEAPQAFTVDQTPPEVKFTGVNHKSANNDEGNIGFTMTATDTNFDVFAPKLVVYYLEDGKFKEKEIDLSGFISDIENGKVLNVENLEEDGVYFLTCTVTDKAGNSFVQFERSDGSMATVEDAMRADGALLAFSANRKGSTFYADKNTIELFKQYYVGEVGNRVVIYEINPDALTSHTVLLNDKELSSGYTVTDLTENGADSERPQSWYKYSYEIDPALFAEEGLYTLVISSEDNAGGTAYSDRKGIRPDSGEGVFSAQFVVDRTQPVVTVSGLEDNGRYQTDRQTVTLIPADDGGQIASLHVLIKDETGKVIDELWLDENGEPLTEEKLRELLDENGGVLTFTLNESPDQYYVYIECTDTAGNKTELEFKEVTVSTSAFRIFWANKPLRWGTIGGAGGAGALAFFLLLAKKRKKKEEEVVPEKKA